MVLGKVVKYGGLFLVAREGIKAFEKHNNHDRTQDQQMPQYARPAPTQPNSTWPDLNDYAHQPYCNGQCHNQCNSPPSYHQQKS
jgi:hypothetical protein